MRYETKMSRLFESNKHVSELLIAELNAKFMYHAASYIQHNQITLNDLYKQYLEVALLSEKLFKTGLQKLLLKKYTS